LTNHGPVLDHWAMARNGLGEVGHLPRARKPSRICLSLPRIFESTRVATDQSVPDGHAILTFSFNSKREKEQGKRKRKRKRWRCHGLVKIINIEIFITSEKNPRHAPTLKTARVKIENPPKILSFFRLPSAKVFMTRFAAQPS
jgi:hypothetical protein